MVRFSIQAITWTFVAALPGFADAPNPDKAAKAAAAGKTDETLPKGAVARLGTDRFLRFDNDITLLGITPNNRAMLLSAARSMVYFMELGSGKVARNSAVAIGKELVACSGDGATLFFTRDLAGDGTLLDVRTGKDVRDIPVGELLGQGAMFAEYAHAQLAHDGQLLTVRGESLQGKTYLSWIDTRTGKNLHRVPAQLLGSRKNTAFTRDGQTLAILEPDDGAKTQTRLRAWNVKTGKEIVSIGFEDCFQEFVFLPDGKSLLAWVGPQHSLRLLETATGKEIRRFRDPRFPIDSFAVSADGKQFFAAGSEGICRWNIATGKLDWSVATQGLTGRLLCALDGRTLSICDKQMLRTFDTTVGQYLAPLESHTGAVAWLAFAGNDWLTSTGLDACLAVWELNGMKKEAIVGPGGVRSMSAFGALTHDRKKVVGLWSDEPIYIWDLKSLKNQGKPRTLGDAEEVFQTMAMSADRKLLAAGNIHGSIRLLEVATGKEVAKFIWHAATDEGRLFRQASITGLAFSSDGRMLAALGFVPAEELRTVLLLRVWELATHTERMRAQLDVTDFRAGEAGPAKLSFSGDGKQLVLGVDGHVSLWDLIRGKEVRQFAGPIVAHAMDISPDGKLLAAGRLDGGIRLWNAQSGHLLGDWQGHSQIATALAFSPNGKRLASGSADTSVLLWDVEFLLKEAQAAATPQAIDPEALWQDLAGADGVQAFRAMGLLASHPRIAVPYLSQRLKPVPAPDAKHLELLVSGLSDPLFEKRSQASAELANLGDLARPALRAVLLQKPSLELRRRVEALLQKLEGPVTSPSLRVALRAVEVLERIDVPEARKVLRRLADGPLAHRLTVEARASLLRLAQASANGVQK